MDATSQKTSGRSVQMSRYILPLGVFVLLAVLLGIGLVLDPRMVPSPLIDKPAPEFSLPTVRDPRAILSRSDLLGKVSLFNVWASWCQACLQEHPALMDLARSGAVPIYGLNYKDQRSDAVSWLARLGDP